jgi:hypothetical protein
VSVLNFVGMTPAQAKQQLPSGFAGALSDFKLGTVTERPVNPDAMRPTSRRRRRAGSETGDDVAEEIGTAVNLVVSAKGKG